MNFIKFRKVGNDEQCIFSVFQKDIKQINRFTGGVLNVQSDLSVFKNETTTSLSSLKNSDVMKHGIVKSVQQGSISFTTSNTLKTYTVNISQVDVNNSILILSISEGHPYRFNLKTDNIEIVYGSSGKMEFYWQVIEFY